jgi:hypothetical protein
MAKGSSETFETMRTSLVRIACLGGVRMGLPGLRERV